MEINQLLMSKAEQQLFSKEAINLPPRKRLELLFKTEKYPIIIKKTSAEVQIREMIDFYNLCCVMLVQYFQNEEAENNFIMLNFITSQENNKSIITGEYAKKLKILGGYEKFESKIADIQMLFCQYRYSFPDLYESYNLEDIATEHISDVIKQTKQLINDYPQFVEKILKRWEILS